MILVIIGVETIAIRTGAVTAKIKIFVLHTVHFKTTHYAISFLYPIGRWGGLRYNLPIASFVVNGGNGHCFNLAA